MKIICAALALLGVIVQVHSHARVMDPPNRSSMWRFGYDYPPNYDDYGIYCGGFSVQWDQNGGKCGFCGDDYTLPQPRPNEHGGTYGLGVIPDTAHYKQGGVLTTTVDLQTSHLGYFEFSICKMENDNSESDACFEQHPLKLADGRSRYEITSYDSGIYTIDLQLPQDLTCSHCVFRWHYRTGNRYGDCGDGTGALGCGAQETFRTCSDIAIEA